MSNVNTNVSDVGGARLGAFVSSVMSIPMSVM